METVLRLAWPRIIFAACFFLLVLIVAFGGVAFAQAIPEAALTEPPVEYTGLAGVANSALAGLASALALLVTMVVGRLWNMIPTAFQAMIDKLTTTDSVQWRENIRQAAYDALVHATVKLKIDPATIKTWEEKNAFLTLAGQFISRFDPDIKALIDKDGDGIPDVLEIALAKIAPQTAMIARPDPLAAPQGFMSATEPARRGVAPVKPRASDAAVEALASKFTRRPKGTVTQ